MEYKIISYGGGEVLFNVFNAIATLLNAQSGSILNPLLKIGLMMGLLWALVQSIYANSLGPLFLKWFMPVFGLMTLLFIPQASVWIVDPVKFGETNKVDHVPLGLAFISSTISNMGHGMTERIESVMSLPDDLKYHKTGSLLASHVIEASRTFHITNVEAQETMRDFVNQCVMYDALLGNKYTLQDLRTSPDIWALVSANASPARSFTFKEPGRGKRGEILTCQAGIPKIQRILQISVNEGFESFGNKIFGIDSKHGDIQRGGQQLKRYLPLSHGLMLGMAKSAEDIMRQQMMIYGVVDGIESKSTALGNAENFAVKRAYLQDRVNQETLGTMAGQKLLSMKNVFEALIYAAFIFIIPLCMLPSGWRFIGNWVSMVLWVQMWPPLYAILNFIMNVAAKSKSAGLTYLGRAEYGVTISNSVGLSNLHADMSAQAGFLTIAVGSLAYAIVKGGASSFVHLAGHLSGPTTASAGRAAENMISGNYSFGNVSSGNVQANNAAFGQQNLSPSYQSGSFSSSDGVTSVISTADGSNIVNVANSNLRSGIQITEGLSNSLTEQAGKSAVAAQNATVAASQAETDAFRQMVELGKHQATQESMGQNYTDSESAGATRAAQDLYQHTKKFSEDNSISMDVATQAIAEAAIGVQGSVGFEALGNGVKTTASVGLRGNLQNTKSDKETFSKAQDYVKQHGLTDSFQTASQASLEGRYGTTNDVGKRLGESISGSLERANSFRTEASAHLSQSDSYSKMASYTKSNAGSINSNLNQEYVDWLPKQALPNSKGAMGQTEANAIHASRPEMERIYQNQFLEEKMSSMENYIKSGAIHSEADVQRSFETIKGGVGRFDGGAIAQVQSTSAQQGFGGDFQVNSNIAGEVIEKINLTEDKLDEISERLDRGGGEFENKIKGTSMWKTSPGVKP